MTDRKQADPAESEPIRTDDMDAELRRHFAAGRSQIQIPAFEALLAAAERDGRISRGSGKRRLPRWKPVAAVAAALIVAVLLNPWEPGPNGVMRATLTQSEMKVVLMLDEARLLADLNRSTLWTAPSDRWLESNPAPDVLGLPRMGKMTYEMQEVKSWL